MSIGVHGGDTLGSEELNFLQELATADFPEHRFVVESNDSGVSWAIFEPVAKRSDIMRFVVCRIDPSVVVLIEDHTETRQYRSASDIEGAAALIRGAAEQAVLNAMNAHAAHTVLQ